MSGGSGAAGLALAERVDGLEERISRIERSRAAERIANAQGPGYMTFDQCGTCGIFAHAAWICPRGDCPRKSGQT